MTCYITSQRRINGDLSRYKLLNYLQGLLMDFHETYVQRIMLTDSDSCCKNLERPVSEENKHLSVYIQFVKEEIEQGLRVYHLSRVQNVVDLMTKQNSKKTFDELWKIATTPLTWIRESTVNTSLKKGVRSQG